MFLLWGRERQGVQLHLLAEAQVQAANSFEHGTVLSARGLFHELLEQVTDITQSQSGQVQIDLKVLEESGLVSRPGTAARRPVHLEAEVFDLMTKWIERYRQQAEERYRRLDALLEQMPDSPTAGEA